MHTLEQIALMQEKKYFQMVEMITRRVMGMEGGGKRGQSGMMSKFPVWRMRFMLINIGPHAAFSSVHCVPCSLLGTAMV